MKKTFKTVFKKLGYSVENVKKVEHNIYDDLSKYNLKRESNIRLFYNSYIYIKKIEAYNLNFYVAGENQNNIIVSLENFKFQVESVEDIFILSEVFIDKDYNFLISDEVILIDIGLNIGVSSIFFSAINNVKHIYAYEPVPYTYKIACINIGLNNIEKITAKNIGLGCSNKNEMFYFNPNFKGNSGIRKDNSYVINKLAENEKEEVIVKIRDIGEEFELIRNNHLNPNIILKIDCEGGEYEIINRLNELNLLNDVKLFMIEWHDKGAQSLENILLENGFQIISRNLETNSGMLYAFNKTK